MGPMQNRGRFAFLIIWLAACGDSDSTTASTTNAPTMSMTADPSSATPGEASESAEGPTTPGPATDGPTTEGPVPTSTTPEGTATSDDDTSAPAGAPMFLSFNTSASKITDGESITFTAILTDPDGVADIIGGSLLTEDEAIDYGPMAVAGEGTFSISLS